MIVRAKVHPEARNTQEGTSKPFRRFLVVRNPVSTNAHTAVRRIADLERSFPDMECAVIETLPGGREANAALLRPFAKKLGKDTLLCIAGGDGTINMVLETLLNDMKLSEEARRTPILPLWGGNANDLAHMLNGRAKRANLPKLVASDEVVKVFPLVCSMTDTSGNVVVRLAACYASFGASAISTLELSKQTARAHIPLSRIPLLRFMWELLIVIPAMSQSPTFTTSEDGKSRSVYEHVIFNGPRFAKITGVKRKLTDQTFHRVVVEQKRLSDLLTFAGALTRPKQAAKFETTHTEFTVLEGTWAQFDGEAMRVYAGTHITVTVGTVPFYALSNRVQK